MDKYNSYDSGMRFLKVSLVNIEVEIRFIDIPIRGPSRDLTFNFSETIILIFRRLRALKFNS